MIFSMNAGWGWRHYLFEFYFEIYILLIYILMCLEIISPSTSQVIYKQIFFHLYYMGIHYTIYIYIFLLSLFFLFVNFSRWRQFMCCGKCVLLAQNIIFVIPIHFAIKQTNAAVNEYRNINIIFLLGFALFRCYYYLLDILKFILFCTQRWLSNNHFSIMQYFSEFLLKKSV